MKFGRLIKNNESRTENKTRTLDQGLFLFFKKALYEVKASGQLLTFNIF